MICHIVSMTYPSTVLIGAVVFLLMLYIIQKKPHSNLPPGPTGLPLYGNILDIKKSDKHGPGILDKWAEQFGDVYYIHLGSYPTVVLNSLETVKEALLKNGDKTSGRPTNVFFFKLTSAANFRFFFNDGPVWKELRRTTLHSLRDFGMGKKSLEQRIQEEARALMQHFDDLEGKAFNPRVILQSAFTNIIASIAFGERYEYDDPEFKQLADLVSMFFANGGFANPERFTPLLTPLIPLVNPNIFRRFKVAKEMKEFLTKTIKNHTETFDPEIIRNFTDIYLKAKDANHFTDTNSEKQLFSAIFDLFFAGSETSATTTRWALLYLIHHPQVQAKCQKIIQEVIGPEKIPSSDDRSKLIYVEATLHEIQRLANIVPYSVFHRVTETMKLSGYTIPKDTLLIPNLHRIHKDPRYWTNPESFSPERWIDSNGKFIKNEAFMPFSIGPRQCLGQTLAIYELFIFLVSLLQKFTITAKDPEHLPKLSGSVGGVHHPDDFEIILRRL